MNDTGREAPKCGASEVASQPAAAAKPRAHRVGLNFISEHDWHCAALRSLSGAQRHGQVEAQVSGGEGSQRIESVAAGARLNQCVRFCSARLCERPVDSRRQVSSRSLARAARSRSPPLGHCSQSLRARTQAEAARPCASGADAQQRPGQRRPHASAARRQMNCCTPRAHRCCPVSKTMNASPSPACPAQPSGEHAPDQSHTFGDDKRAPHHAPRSERFSR